MTFLPIVECHLRVASRRRGTYWMRSALALGAMAIWLFLVTPISAEQLLEGQRRALWNTFIVPSLGLVNDMVLTTWAKNELALELRVNPQLPPAIPQPSVTFP